MANFKVNNIVPDVGEIKVGTANVSKIFQGATLVWPITQGDSPGTSTVCGGNIAWTTANSTITATTTGPAIQIVESVSAWNTAYANQTPAAAYYNYASADATEPRGLYYNEFAVAVIQPPTGFRVPTSNDRAALLIASCIDLSACASCLSLLYPQKTYKEDIHRKRPHPPLFAQKTFPHYNIC